MDLWTSDVEGSRQFYSDLFGWFAAEPSEEFAGYWMFLREGPRSRAAWATWAT
jgi:predicted enzyme related to lactoylglutathione lyase